MDEQRLNIKFCVKLGKVPLKLTTQNSKCTVVKRYHVRVWMACVFMKDGRQWKNTRDPAVHPPLTHLRTLSKSEIFCNKIVKLPSNTVRQDEYQWDGLSRNFMWGSWEEKTECQTQTAQSNPLRTRGGLFYSLCWPCVKCKQGWYILLFHHRCRWNIMPTARCTNKKKSREWTGTNSPALKKPCAQPSNTKTMLIAFFNCRGVVHKESIHRSQTVNQDAYKGVLQPLHDSIQCCCPQVVGSSEVVPLTWQCMATWHYETKNFHQYIRSLYCHMHCIIQICHLAIFLIPKTEMNTERPSLCWHSGHSDSHDKTTLQHSRKCFPRLFQRPPEHCKQCNRRRRKIFQRRFLAPESKYTILIFKTSVLELSKHRLYKKPSQSGRISVQT